MMETGVPPLRCLFQLSLSNDAELSILPRLLIATPGEGGPVATLAGLFHITLSYGVIEPAARANNQNPRPS